MPKRRVRPAGRRAGAAPALSAGALAIALAACGHAGPVPVDAPYTPMAEAQACQTETGLRAPDWECDSPHVHFYPVWAPIYPDGSYVPGYGGTMVGWTRSRPSTVVNNTTIVHMAPGGGSVTRTGSGSAVLQTTSTSGGGRIPPAPAGYKATASGRTDQAPPSASGGNAPAGTSSSTATAAGSGTVSRGGLGVTGSSPSAASAGS